MFISVVLPAPFSPTMPWMVPRATVRSTPRLAIVAPNRLTMPRSAMAGTAAKSIPGSIVVIPPRVLLRHVVRDLDPSGDDVGAGGIDLGLHFRRDERGV